MARAGQRSRTVRAMRPAHERHRRAIFRNRVRRRKEPHERGASQPYGGVRGKRGLRLDEDVGASDYRGRYFGRSAARMRGYEFYRIAIAQVPDRLNFP